jgi:glucan biosynthesis protein C
MRNARLHYWDVARASLMLLGIPLHAASFFSPTVSFIQSTQASVGFDFGGGLIHAFRMAAFYCVAGFFAGMLLARRDPMTWWTGRIIRLGVPLVVGVMLLGPYHVWLEAIAASQRNGSTVAHEFARFAASTNYWRWFHHLWFLVPLIWMCSIAAGLHARFPALSRWRLPAGIEKWVTAHFVVSALGLAVVIGIYRYATNGAFQFLHVHENKVLTTVFFVSDLALYLPFFAVGMLLSRAEKLLDRFAQPTPVLWIVGVVSMIGFAAFNALHQQPITAIMLRMIAGICVTHIFISAAKTWFNRPSRLVEQIVAASFGIYMLHYPIIATLGLALNDVAGPVVVKYVGLCVAALAGSYALAQAARLNKWSDLVVNGAWANIPAGAQRTPPTAQSANA